MHIIYISIYMEDNIFLHSLEPNLGTPWHTKSEQAQGVSSRRHVICNLHGRPIAHMYPAGGGKHKAHNYRYTNQLIKNSPIVLAALLEATFTLHSMGILPSEETIQLIKSVGGPDLSTIPKDPAVDS